MIWLEFSVCTWLINILATNRM